MGVVRACHVVYFPVRWCVHNTKWMKAIYDAEVDILVKIYVDLILSGEETES